MAHVLVSCGPPSCRPWRSLLARVPWLDSGLWLMFLCRRRPRLSFILRARELPFGAASARMSPVAWLRPVAYLHGLAPPLFALRHLAPLSIAIDAVHASLFLQALELPFLAVSARTCPVACFRPGPVSRKRSLRIARFIRRPASAEVRFGRRPLRQKRSAEADVCPSGPLPKRTCTI